MHPLDSPSAQLVEPSEIDFNGPPSSPFVTEVDPHSRSASKQWKTSMAQPIFDGSEAGSPNKQDLMDFECYAEDKENTMPVDATATLAKVFSTPKKITTPEPMPTSDYNRSRSSNNDADLMPPPPSTRKLSESARKTPRPSSRSGARTPKSLSRGNSFDRTPAQSAANFQAGLDMRNSMLPVDDQPTMDDTCFSAFSEIPEMTVFARLGQSPTKRGDLSRKPETTPRSSRKRSSPSRSPSPTPRKQKTPRDETTTFLIDFTQQIDGPGGLRAGSPLKSATESNLLQYISSQRSPSKSTNPHYATPNKKNNNLLNLLDFDLPPAPTPRSIPTITVRELESLKSSYLSQISSLKATLSGREAEVESLKRAVGDAERRVGEALETLRDETSRREHVEQDVENWKRRGQEFESVLKNVKEEVLKSETEKEDMNSRLADAEKRIEDAEARAIKAEERFADALAARGNANEGGDSNMEEQVQLLVSAQIDAKIEAVSRELHAVYKEKHERKVATLKKSYEARNEKKAAELQSRVSDLERANEELQAARDATFSGPIPNPENADLKAQLEEQKAALARLESQIEVSQSQQRQLELELQQERIEKGDLVAAVDEMLALQSEAPPQTPSGVRAVSVVEDFRKSISRPPSGLRAPASGESRIGRGPVPPSALARSTSGIGKSKMLANIERMGRTGSNSGSGSQTE